MAIVIPTSPWTGLRSIPSDSKPVAINPADRVFMTLFDSDAKPAPVGSPGRLWLMLFGLIRANPYRNSLVTMAFLFHNSH